MIYKKKKKDLTNCFAGGYWSEMKNRKLFFDTFALENQFDPLVPDNWYSTTKKSLISHKVIYYYYY